MITTLKTFAQKAVAPTMALSLIVAFSATAQVTDKSNAELVQMQQSISQMHGFVILDDAHRPSNRWVVNHPDRIAVSVVRGTKTEQKILNNINPVLIKLFTDEGVPKEKLQINWEDGKGVATVMMFHTDRHVTQSLSLMDAPSHIKTTVKRMRFNPVPE